MPGGTKLCPPLYIVGGVNMDLSPKSYRYCPRLIVGQERGSAAMKGISLPASLSARNGNARPAKLLPPAQQPMTMSA